MYHHPNGDLAGAMFLDLIDSEHRMHRLERAQPSNSLLMRSSVGSRTTLEHSPNSTSSTSINPNNSPWPTFTTLDLVNLALIHEHNAKNVTGCHGSMGDRC